MATSNTKSNSDGRSSSSANAKNRNFISFLALNQQNEKKRLKSQISKMCSISFKKLDVVDDSTTMPCVIKNSNYTKSNLINLSDFTNKFESLDLNQKDNGDDDDEGGDDDLRKISILNNYFSNSILSNYNNINVNNNDAAGKSNDESNLDTQRTSNNYNNSTSFNKNRPESLLSDRCKSEGFDEEIQYDNDNDNENYFDM